MWRRGLASLLGGLSSLVILLPEIPFFLLFLIKLLTAGGITLVATGFGSFKLFGKQMLFFFGVNFIFAGFMIALWLVFAPPRLTIRNGSVYYHIPAMTLIVSTILAYFAARVLAFFWERRVSGKETYRARIAMDGRETLLTVFVDTGNRLRGPGGLPVIVCEKGALSDLLPEETLAAFASPGKAGELRGTRWETRLRLIPCETVSGSRVLCGFLPDSFTPEGGDAFPCILALSEHSLSDGEYQAVSGPTPLKAGVPSASPSPEQIAKNNR